MQIETIRLEGMLPRVFENEPAAASDVWRADLTLSRGETLQIEAASGAGKSSLCAYIYGARRDFSGRLLFNGRDTSALSIGQWQELRRRHLAYLPQELALFPELTARENIELKNRLTGSLDKRRIDEMLEQLGIADRADYPCGRMSVGQQQRVAIIRALCQPFDFILLDEPVSHLDPANNRAAAEMITREAARHGAAIVSTSVGNPLALADAKTLRL